jgi:hypothetical protein
MDGNSDQIIPRARERGLIVRELDEETIVYELETDRAHCLNPISAAVWKHCDGRTTVAEMVDILRETQQDPVAEDTVWQAVLQLAQYELLEEQVSRPTHGSMSRREWMKRTGLTAAVALPLITSLTVPSAYAAGASCITAGNPCTTAAACCSGLTCGPAHTCCIPNGDSFMPCTSSNQCCNGSCHSLPGSGNKHCVA